MVNMFEEAERALAEGTLLPTTTPAPTENIFEAAQKQVLAQEQAAVPPPNMFEEAEKQVLGQEQAGEAAAPQQPVQSTVGIGAPSAFDQFMDSTMAIGSGALRTAGGMLFPLESIVMGGGENVPEYSPGSKLLEWGTSMMPDNPNFAQQLSAAGGSMLGAWGPAGVVGKLAGRVAASMPAIGRAIGLGTAAINESLAEAGNAGWDAQKQYGDADRTNTAMARSFMANMIVNGVTTAVGGPVMEASLGRLKKFLLLAPLGSSQEAIQTGIDAWAKDEELDYDEVKLSALIGFALEGVGATMLSPAPDKPMKPLETRPIQETADYVNIATESAIEEATTASVPVQSPIDATGETTAQAFETPYTESVETPHTVAIEAQQAKTTSAREYLAAVEKAVQSGIPVSPQYQIEARVNYSREANTLDALASRDAEAMELAGVDMATIKETAQTWGVAPKVQKKWKQDPKSVPTSAIQGRIDALLGNKNSTYNGIVNKIESEYGVPPARTAGIFQEEYGIDVYAMGSLQYKSPLTMEQVTSITEDIYNAKRAGLFTNINDYLLESGFDIETIPAVTSGLAFARVNVAPVPPNSQTNLNRPPKDVPDTPKQREKLRTRIQALAVQSKLLSRLEPTLDRSTDYERMGTTQYEFNLLSAAQKAKMLNKLVAKESRQLTDTGFDTYIKSLHPNTPFADLSVSQLQLIRHKLLIRQGKSSTDKLDIDAKGNQTHSDAELNAIINSPHKISKGHRNFYEAVRNPVRLLGNSGLRHMYLNVQGATTDSKVSRIETMQAIEDYGKQLKLPMNKKTWQTIAAHALWQQPEAFDALKAQGVKNPNLQPGSPELELYTYIHEQLENIFLQLDATQRLMGQQGAKILQYTDNYFTFFRDFTQAMSDGMEYMSTSNSGMKTKMKTAQETIFNQKKSRVMSKRALSLDGKTILESYLSGAYKFIHLAPELSKISDELNGTIKGSPQGDYRLRKENPVLYDQVQNWVNYVAYGDQSTKTHWIVRHMMSNLAGSYVALNPSTIINQPAALLLTGRHTGIMNTINGILHMHWDIVKDSGIKSLFKEKNWEIGSSGMKLSDGRWLKPGIRQRYKSLGSRSFDAIAQDANAIVPSDWVRMALWSPKKILEVGGNLIQISDEYTAMASAYAFQRYGQKKLGLQGQELHDYVNEMVVKTNASGSPHDVAPLQRNVFGRSITLLSTFQINQMGAILEDAYSPHPAQKTTMSKEIIKAALYMTLLQEALSALYEDLFPWAIQGTTGAKVTLYSPIPSPLRRGYQEMVDGGTPFEIAGVSAREYLDYFPWVNSINYGSNPSGLVGQAIETAGDIASGEYTGTENELMFALRIAGVPTSAIRFWTERIEME